MATLSGYLSQLRYLLRDPSDQYWPQAEKTFYLNEALKKRDRDTGQNRTLITFVTTVGVDTYTFTNIGNTRVYDLIGINLLYQNVRVPMACLAFSELNERLRRFSPALQWAPVGYARYGPAQFVLAPAPAIAYSIELDCAQTVADNFLVALTDADPLPAPFDTPVQYWAARLAKIAERQLDEADYFESLYNDAVSKLDSTKVGMVPQLGGLVRR